MSHKILGFLCVFFSALPIYLAADVRYFVSGGMDTSFDHCTDGFANDTHCTLRAALAQCGALDATMYSNCIITIEGTNTLVPFDSNLGSMKLISSAPPIIVNGNAATIYCRDCGTAYYVDELIGFPFSTGRLSNTNFAQQNSAIREVRACNGDVLEFSSCSKFRGDPYFRLYDSSFNVVSESDDACGYASRIIHPVTNSGCTTFYLSVGCWSMETCSMVVSGTVLSPPQNETVLEFSHLSGNFGNPPRLTLNNLTFSKMSRVIDVSENIVIVMTSITVEVVKNAHGAPLQFANLDGSASITMVACAFRQMVGTTGAAIRIDNSSALFVISNSIFFNCSAKSGGAIYVDSNTKNVVIRGSTFGSCIASNYGGAIYLHSSNHNILIANNTFIDCQSQLGSGGALCVNMHNSDVTVSGSVFIDCSADDHGAAIYGGSMNTRVLIENSLMSNCLTAVSGGCVYISSGNTHFTLSNVLIANSSSVDGAAVAIDENNEGVVFDRCQFTDNRAKFGGGAVHVKSKNSYVVFAGCEFTRNVANGWDGGAVAIIDTNYGVMFMDAESYSGYTSIRMEPVATLSSLTYTYTVPENATSVIIAFDVDSSIEQSGYLTSIQIVGDGWNEFYYSETDYFPGVHYPAERVSGFEVLKVTYTFPSLSRFAPYPYGVKLNFIPVTVPSAVTRRTLFENNAAVVGKGGGLFCHLNNMLSILINTVFDGNTASHGGGVYYWMGNSLFVMEQLVFRSNAASQNGGGIVLMYSHLRGILSGALFSNNSAAISGGGMYFGTANGRGMGYTRTYLSIYSIFITCSSAGNGGGVYFDSDNVVDMYGVEIMDNEATGGSGGGVYLGMNNEFWFIDSIVSGNHAVACGGGVASIQNSNKLVFKNLSFEENNAGGIGGGLCMKEGTSLLFKNKTMFLRNSARIGGGIGSMGCEIWQLKGLSDEPSITFAENVAHRGSAMFFFDIVSSPNSLHNIKMTANVANIGGTVFWIYNENSISSEPPGLYNSSMVYQNNSVGYGEVATQGVMLNTLRTVDVNHYLTPLPPISMNITDYYNQAVVDFNETVVTVTLSGSRYNCSGRPGVLQSSSEMGTTAYIRNGLAYFYGLDVYCAPGGSLPVRFNTAALNVIPNAVADSMLDLFAVTGTSIFEFRLCDIGEFEEDGNCLSCPTGTYSLHLGAKSCTSCVGKEGVLTCQDKGVYLLEGFWRRYDTNEAVLKCPLESSACPGGLMTGEAACAEGYVGPLCAVCKEGYYLSDGVCFPCAAIDSVVSAVLFFLFVLFIVLGGYFGYHFFKHFYVDHGELQRHMSKMAESNALNEDSEHKDLVIPELTSYQFLYLWLRKKVQDMTIKAKIVTSTFQVVTTSASVFMVGMPRVFTKFTDAFQFLNLDVYSVLPLGCSQNFDFMQELLWVTLSPICLVFLTIVAVGSLKIRHKYFRPMNITEAESLKHFMKWRARGIVFFFYVSYLVLPSVSVKLFQIFICQNIDPDEEDATQDDYFLVADMSISCSSNYYKNWLVYAAFMIIIYPIGIPLSYFVMLYRNRVAIQSRELAESGSTTSGQNAEAAIPTSSVAPDVAAAEPTALDQDSKKNINVSSSSRRESGVLLLRVKMGNDIDGSSVVKASSLGLSASSHRLPPNVRAISFLWAAYEPQYWYWEVVESVRRIVLTAVLSVISPGTSSQNVLSLLLSVFFIKIYSSYAPFHAEANDVLAELGQFQVFFTYFGAMSQQNDLLPKVYDTLLGALLIVINLLLPVMALYFEVRDYYSEFESLEIDEDDEEAFNTRSTRTKSNSGKNASADVFSTVCSIYRTLVRFGYGQNTGRKYFFEDIQTSKRIGVRTTTRVVSTRRVTCDIDDAPASGLDAT